MPIALADKMDMLLRKGDGTDTPENDKVVESATKDFIDGFLQRYPSRILESLLQDKTTLDRMWILRKYISDMNPVEAMNTIHKSMEHTRSNDEFLLSMNS